MTMNLFYIHWNETELKQKIIPLIKAGYKVKFHFDTELTADLKNHLPDALIICLDRLPSHGRAYAEWMWEAKKRQHIPVIFCGGKEEKVKAIKEKFPKAVFCTNEDLLTVLKNV